MGDSLQRPVALNNAIAPLSPGAVGIQPSKAADTGCGYGLAEARGRSRPLTRAQRAQLKQDYGSPGADERVLRMLEQLERVEADLSHALQSIMEMEWRLARTPARRRRP
jgi:hypothetical protein